MVRRPTLDINRRTTIIIDECAMADNDKLGRALVQHAEKAGCRVVLVGDERQLAAIGPGGLFRGTLPSKLADDQETAPRKLSASGRPGPGMPFNRWAAARRPRP